MSYCRFLENDAYIYATRGGIECCGCSLAKSTPLDPPYTDILGIVHDVEYERMLFKTSREALEHIAKHREAGDYITLDADERIKQDYPNLDEEIVD